MILKASKNSGLLTKEAIVGTLARGAGKVGLGLGKTIAKNPMTSVGMAGGGLMTAHGFKKGLTASDPYAHNPMRKTRPMTATSRFQ